MIKYISLIFFVLISLNTTAQINKQLIDTVIIQTSHIPLQLKETGRSAVVITSNEIKNLPVNSIDEVIRFTAGIEVQSRGGFGVQSDFSIRGSTFNQVLVLVDGMRLNDPLTGHFNSNIPVALAEVERIEIIKGAGSALYGPDAVGGIIHIITKTASILKSENTIEAQFAFGDYGLNQQQIGVFKQKNNWKFGVGLQRNESAGQPFQSGQDGKNFFNLNTLGASASKQWGKNQLFFRTGYDDRAFNARYFYTRSTADQSVERTTNWWNHLKFKHIGDKVTRQLDLVYKHSTDSFLFNPLFPANLHTMQFLNLQGIQTNYISKKIKLASGFQVDNRQIKSTDRGNHTDWHAGLFSQLGYQLFEQLNFSTSIRADFDENYGFELTPQLSISYFKEKHTLRALAARAIRAADYTERFVSTGLNFPLGAGRNIGNPDLQSESSLNFELGYDYQHDNLQFGITGFYRKGSNLIDYVVIPGSQIVRNNFLNPTDNYFHPINIGRVDTRGIELVSQYKKKIKNGHLHLSLAYTLVVSTNADKIISKYLTNHGRNLINYNISFFYKRLVFSANGLWKDRVPDAAAAINASLKPSYAVHNVQLKYQFANKKLLPFIQIQNWTNNVYTDILGAEMPTRWVMMGIQAKL